MEPAGSNLRIEILGRGCAQCDQLAAMAEAAARASGRPFELIRVTALERIIAYDVVATPALVIDGTVRCLGRVPSSDELRAWFAAAR